MSLQLGIIPNRVIRDNFRQTNPVTSTIESFTLLESAHLRGFQDGAGSDQNELVTGLGGFGSMWSCYASGGPNNTAQFVGASNIADAYGQANAVSVGTASGMPYGPVCYQITGYNGAIGGENAPVLGDPVSFGFLCKANTLTQVGISLAAGAGLNNVSIFSLSTGLSVGGCVGTTGVSQSDMNVGKIFAENVGNGWWYFTGRGLTMNSGLSASVQVWLCAAGTTVIGSYVNTQQLYLGWGSAFTTCPGPTYPITGTKPNATNNADPWGFEYSPAAINFSPAQTGADLICIPLGTSLNTPQAMTIYLEYLERGNSARLSGYNAGICRVGDMLAVNTTPYINIFQTPTQIVAIYHNGTTFMQSATNVAPTWGQLVAVRCTLTALGVVQVYASVNGGSETVGSTPSAITLPVAWSDTYLSINGLGTTNAGDMALRRITTWQGVQPLSVVVTG